jgi:hypothetical protein
MDVNAVCYNHPDKPATKGCWRCQQFICNDCSVKLYDKTYCRKCAGEVSKISANPDKPSILKREINSRPLIVAIVIFTLIIAAVEIYIMTR